MGRWLKTIERGDKQPGHEQHQKTEGHLDGDQRVHQPAPRVRVRAAAERRHRFDGGGAQSRREAEEQSYGEGQRQTEPQHAPVRRQHQARRIVRRIDSAHHERRRPPREQAARRGREATPARRFPPAPVAPAAIVPPRSRRAAPSRAPAPPPAPSSGWPRWRTRSSSTSADQHAQSCQRACGSRSANPEAPAAAGSSISLSGRGNFAMSCLLQPMKPFVRFASNA